MGPEIEQLEHERLKGLEERQAASFEKIAEAVATMTLSMARMDERLTQLLGGFAEHDKNMERFCREMRANTKPVGRQRKPSTNAVNE